MKNKILTIELRVKIDCKRWYDIFPVQILDRYEAPLLFFAKYYSIWRLSFFFLVVMIYLRLEMLLENCLSTNKACVVNTK